MKTIGVDRRPKACGDGTGNGRAPADKIGGTRPAPRTGTTLRRARTPGARPGRQAPAKPWKGLPPNYRREPWPARRVAEHRRETDASAMHDPSRAAPATDQSRPPISGVRPDPSPVARAKNRKGAAPAGRPASRPPTRSAPTPKRDRLGLAAPDSATRPGSAEGDENLMRGARRRAAWRVPWDRHRQVTAGRAGEPDVRR